MEKQLNIKTLQEMYDKCREGDGPPLTSVYCTLEGYIKLITNSVLFKNVIKQKIKIHLSEDLPDNNLYFFSAYMIPMKAIIFDWKKNTWNLEK